MDESAVPDRIKQLRESAGMGQTEFAAAVGLKRGETVHRWEHGKTTPNLSEVIAMARVFGRSLDWFAGIDEQDPVKRLADLSVGIQTRVERIEYQLETLVGELQGQLEASVRRESPGADRGVSVLGEKSQAAKGVRRIAKAGAGDDASGARA